MSEIAEYPLLILYSFMVAFGGYGVFIIAELIYQFLTGHNDD